MNKKVAIIIERAETALGGAERSGFELAQGLREIGIEADILAAKGENAEGVKVLCGHLPGKRVCHNTFGRALKKYLAENHYDIVHSFLPFEFADIYQPRGGCYAEAIVRNTASYENKFIKSWKNTTSFMNIRRAQLLSAEKKLCANADGPVVAALSSYVARQFKEHYGLSDNRIVIIPNGVKTDKTADSDSAAKLKARVLSELKISELQGGVFFLFAANNFRLKGLVSLLKAFYFTSFERAFLIIAGSGKAKKYHTLAKQLDIQNRVVFVGAVPNIQNALSIADVAVLPTFYDPSSRFILEALAAGKPVVTTAFNGAADIFVNKRHGTVIDKPENISALSEAIDYFSRKENISNASQAILGDNLQEKISINRVAKQMESLYNSIPVKRNKV